jgi:sulfate transport system ATP-binding protein
MSFLGPISAVDGKLVRPHDISLSHSAANGDVRATVKRVVHLGFEVRIELVMDDGSTARVQLTRAQTAELGLSAGQEVYVHPPESKVIGRADEHPEVLGSDDDPLSSEAVA